MHHVPKTDSPLIILCFNKFSNEQIYNEVSLGVRILSILSTRTTNISVNINKDKITECADKFRIVINNMSKLKANMNNVKKEVDQTIANFDLVNFEFLFKNIEISNFVLNSSN